VDPDLLGPQLVRQILVRRLAWLLLALLLWPTLGAAAAPALSGTVSWVYDGDTLEIEPLGKVRLLGIDAPESVAGPRDDYYLHRGLPATLLRQTATAAKAYLIQQVKGHHVRLTLDRTPRDKYDRLLGYVQLEDGRLLNRLLLEKGLATVFRRFNFKLKQDFLAAEAAAQKRQVGLWQQQD
jgi:micrococcal nuclease